MGEVSASPLFIFSMPSCLESVVTLGACPDEGVSKSGFTLLSAPGISIKGLASTANETYMSGANLAMAKKAISLTQVKNDFIGALQANKVVPFITDPTHSAGVFVGGTSMGNYSGERGITLHKNASYRGGLRKTYIKSVQLYPLANGNADIKIYDGNTVTVYAVTLVAGQVNTFDSTQLDGFPYLISANSSAVRVLVDNTDIPFASADIRCLKGCGGTMPNPCGWVDGWNGSGAVKNEGFGVNVEFYCSCDYEKILCDLSNSFSGELIWLKWQYNIYEEQYKTNRFNSWVTYNREEIKDDILPDLERKYNQKWNDMMGGLLGILQTYRDDCLICKGIRWRTNI